jgi:hypothetical protein
MVLVDELAVGGEKLEGTGGIVLTNTPADAGLEQFLTGAGFELGGYVTTALMHVWTVTYDLPEGKVFIKARPAGK